MFSANENLMLREHKRRVVNYVEETIPEDVLDMGTTVMVMETKCRTPGCVPLETSIVIVFPRLSKELIPNLKESNGGSYKAKVLLPLSEVTRDDVLDALPPEFMGGRKTWESTCFAVRDLLFGRIGGLVGSGDEEGEIEDRKVLAEYMRAALDDYLKRGCVAPPLGEPFEPLNKIDTENDLEDMSKIKEEKDDNVEKIQPKKEVNVIQGSMTGNGNFIIRREEEDDNETITKSGTMKDPTIINKVSHSSKIAATNATNSSLTNNSSSTRSESAMEWRRRQNMSQSLQLGSDNIIQRLAEREHAPGVRSPGCPCCDPDNIQNVVEGMML